MHMQGEPKTMQQMPRYDDILIEVEGFLRGRVQAALAAGLDRRRIVLDPGYGFGKTPEQNYRLLRQLRDVDSGGYPWTIGSSRNPMIGQVIVWKNGVKGRRGGGSGD